MIDKEPKNLIECGTCGYPLTPEERTTLIERNGVMCKPWVGLTESDRRLINYQWQDGNGTATEIIDLVEAKLEEKNT